MSFLAGRLAATESAYFLQESKKAIGKLARKLPSSPPPTSPTLSQEELPRADVLPEILRHSIPLKLSSEPSGSSLSTSSKWVLLPNKDFSYSSNFSPDVMNPLRGYVSLPQVTLGPQRWQLPKSKHSIFASTANELRTDRYTHIDSEKLKTTVAGLSYIGKAFLIATALVFGGTALAFSFIASKLQLHKTEDIKIKGRDLIRPRFDSFRQQLLPLQIWVENTSKKWHIDEEKESTKKPIFKELSKTFGTKSREE